MVPISGDGQSIGESQVPRGPTSTGNRGDDQSRRTQRHGLRGQCNVELVESPGTDPFLMGFGVGATWNRWNSPDTNLVVSGHDGDDSGVVGPCRSPNQERWVDYQCVRSDSLCDACNV